MSRPRLQTFVQRLGAELSGYAVARGLIYAAPVSLVLRGFSTDPSGFQARTFYLWAFAQPLYVPVEYKVFTFGRRLGERGGTHDWVLEPEREDRVADELLREIRSVGIPFVERLSTPRKLATAAARYPGTEQDYFRWYPDDINVIEPRAYSWLLAGEEAEARRDLQHLASGEFGPNRDWEQEIQQRAQQVLAALNRGQTHAINLLHEWAQYSAKHLKLEITP